MEDVLNRVIEISDYLFENYPIKHRKALELAIQVQKNEVLSLYNKLYIRENEYPNSFDNIATELRDAKDAIINIMSEK